MIDEQHVVSLDVVLGDRQMCVGKDDKVEGIDYPIQ
jgi:hypothetical protein